jgi:Porin subfamily
MRILLLVMLVVTSSASMALADSAGRLKLDYTTPPTTALPVKGAGARNACAEYGTGFRKVEGTDTCVKVGGSVRLDVSSGAASR